jgi:hypothetical protein
MCWRTSSALFTENRRKSDSLLMNRGTDVRQHPKNTTFVTNSGMSVRFKIVLHFLHHPARISDYIC